MVSGIADSQEHQPIPTSIGPSQIGKKNVIFETSIFFEKSAHVDTSTESAVMKLGVGYYC